MDSFFSRYRNPLVLVLVLLAQFVLLAVQVQPRLPGATVADQAGVQALRTGVTSVVTPPEKVAHRSGLNVRNLWSAYMELVDTKQENRELLAENQRLKLEQAGLKEDAREGERLQELLAFKQHYVDTTVPAQVVGTSGTDHGHVLYIDKGSDDGIQLDMAVITPDGIVGRVRSVSAGTSQVLAINDPTSAAGALLEETRTRGIVRGDGVGHTQIVNLMPDSRIKPGQTVLTSGGDQVFPRGLPIGTVDRIVVDQDNAPLVDVILKPAANLGQLEEVLVITGTGPQMSSQTKRDIANSTLLAASTKNAAEAKAAEAAEAALEAQSASDILAARLPSATNVSDADAPDAAPGASPTSADASVGPLHPPLALRPDQYTPAATPDAANLTPGQRAIPLAEGIPSTDRVNHPTNGQGAAPPSPAESAAFLAAHNAAVAARPHTVVAKPAVPASSTAAQGGVKASPAAGLPGTVGHGATSYGATGYGSANYGAANSGSASHAYSANPANGTVPHSVVPHAATPSGLAGATGAPIPHRVTPSTATSPVAHQLARPAIPAGTATHPSATRPATQGATGQATPNGAAPQHRVTPGTATQGSVPTQVVTDGPLPATRRPATPAQPQHRPTIVPDDGSRPPVQPAPQSSSQPNQNQGPQ